MKHLKNIFAVFWIAVLVFALSGRTVHVFFEHGHDHEFVCKETSTHIHEKEHTCFICEFDLQLGDGQVYQQPSLEIAHIQKQIQAFFPEFVPASFAFHFTSRGPPVA